MSQSKYINIKNFMQDEYPWTFIVGSRSNGKTINSFVTMINEFLNSGRLSIYMRRFDTEIERTAIDLNLVGSLTGTELAREKVKINGVATDVITVNEEPAIYMIALSVAGKFKSNAFPNILQYSMMNSLICQDVSLRMRQTSSFSFQ